MISSAPKEAELSSIPQTPIPKVTPKNCRWNVLLVEDNEADALLFSAIFKEKCPEAHLKMVFDGEEAVEALFGRGSFKGEPTPDVVLLDLNLPKKNGFEVLAEARSEPRLRNLPVFLLSTSSAREDVERARALGVASFLTKPSDLEELELIIDRLVEVQIPEAMKSKPASLDAEKVPSLPVTDRGEVSAEAFRLLIDAVKDYAIFMLDPRGYILTWNEGAMHTKQYKPSEILGKHFSVFYTPEDVARKHPEAELKIAEKEGRYQEEGWRLRKDGTQFWANVTITAIRDRSGALLGFGKVTRDMSDRKSAEESLRQSEERFRILADGVVDYAIFMLDPSGHIMSWNRGAERINGYRAAEVLGKHFSIFYTEKSKKDQHPEYELRTAIQNGSYEEEGIRVRKDGSTFWANVTITPLYDGTSTLRGFAKVTRDITERKHGEEEIKALNEDLERRVLDRTEELELSKAKLEEQKEQLVRSNSDLQQFAYVASHDLQEPLRVVVSYLQFLERRVKNQLDAESLQFVDIAVKSAHRMRSLVQDLLSYSRIEKNKQPLPVNLNDVARDARSNLEARIRESHGTVVIGSLPTLPGDFGQLVQVFQNLLGNALVYKSPARVPEIQVTALEEKGGWTISFKDNGIGIGAQYFQKIFIIFQRLHSDRDKYPGTGIGLAICKRIVERHGGRIWLDSIEGSGTTFHLWLPKQAEAHD